MCSRGEYWPFMTFLGMFLVRYLPHWKCFLQKLPYFSLDLRPEIEMPRRLANSSDAGDFFERKLTSRWLVWTKNMLISNNGWRRFGRVFTKLSTTRSVSTTGKNWYEYSFDNHTTHHLTSHRGKCSFPGLFFVDQQLK